MTAKASIGLNDEADGAALKLLLCPKMPENRPAV